MILDSPKISYICRRNKHSHASLLLVVILLSNALAREALRDEIPSNDGHPSKNNSSPSTGVGGRWRSESVSANRQRCETYVSFLSKPRWRLGRRGLHANAKTAYRMAVLSTLAYWEFHKSPDAYGFGLLGDPRARMMDFRAILGLRLRLCRVRRVVSNTAARLKTFLRDRRRTKKTRWGTEKTRSGAGPLMTCREALERKDEEGLVYKFAYWLYDWFEPTGVPGVNYHDTDLLVSTSGDNILTLAFAGTASAADHVTNVQTFEPATHSGLFDGGNNLTIEGSLHRGFLNAYSRVERGSVVRLCQNCSSPDGESISELTRGLHRRYGHCVPKKKKKWREKKEEDYEHGIHIHNDTNTDRSNKTPQNKMDAKRVKTEKKGGCRARGETLLTILRETVTDALLDGRSVHLTGHSLGGGLATLLAFDIVINFPHVPVNNLHIWTFGAPQVADDVFLRSAVEAAPRLIPFIGSSGNGRFHRFVTLSDDCRVDFISDLLGRALPGHQNNLRGRAARTLGGVRGSVVHFTDPHYLLTPDQYNNTTYTAGTDTTQGTPQSLSKTRTGTAVTAHSTINYLQGISRESKDHPLLTDLPPQMGEWLGHA